MSDVILVGLLLLAGAVGHAAVWCTLLNLLHGTRYRNRFTKAFHKFVIVFVPSGPLLFVLYYHLHLLSLETWQTLPLEFQAYLVLCWVAGGVIFPIVTIQRWLRVTPPQQIAYRCETIDVGKHVAVATGQLPAGDGKHALLMRFPGNGVLNLDILERELRLPRLPAELEGLTILHISDLHLMGTPSLDYYKWVFEHAGQREVDLVAITGDLMDSEEHHPWLLSLVPRLRSRYGKYGILGNHDVEWDPVQVHQVAVASGLQMIGGRFREVSIRGVQIVLIGNEVPWIRPAPDMSGMPEGFRLCLSHSPDTMPWARRNRIDLMLAGHTHGGQIRIPGVGPVLLPSRYGRYYDNGLFWEPPTLLVLSRGLGGTYPIRLGCNPEITYLTLRGDTCDSLSKDARPERTMKSQAG